MCLTKELSWDACNAHATVYFFCRQHIAHTRKQIDMRPCADTYFVKELLKSISCHCATQPQAEGQFQLPPVSKCTRKQNKEFYYFELGNGRLQDREADRLRKELFQLKLNTRHQQAPSTVSSPKSLVILSRQSSKIDLPNAAGGGRVKIENGDQHRELKQIDDHKWLMDKKAQEAAIQTERDRMFHQENEMDRENTQIPRPESKKAKKTKKTKKIKFEENVYIKKENDGLNDEMEM